jgi:hypothetical protein
MIYTDCALAVSQSIYFIANESGSTTLALANCPRSDGYANVVFLLGIKQWWGNIIRCSVDGGPRYGTIELYSGLGSCWIYFGGGLGLLDLWSRLIFAMLISFGATLRRISSSSKRKRRQHTKMHMNSSKLRTGLFTSAQQDHDLRPS